MNRPIDLIVLGAVCALLLLIAGLTRYRPPQRINELYGYRTARSMRTPATWQAANSYFARYFWRLSWALPVVATVATWLVGARWALLPLAGGLVAGLLFGAVRTERHLRQLFDDHGQPR